MVSAPLGAIPSSLRRINERTIVGLLRRLGSASRAELAKAAGMSQPTAGKITSELLDLGILQEIETAAEAPIDGRRTTARLGRPGRRLRLDGEKPRFIAIQLGVAETRAAALPVLVEGEDRWTCAFPTGGTPSDWVARLGRAAARLPKSDLWGVLISVPGIVDEKAGKVLFSPNLHWTERTSLSALVREVWNAPVLLVQEIRALALGHLAAEPRGEDFLLVDFGQGVGGAVIEGGKLHSHPLPLSGELGHTPVLGNARPCGCGATGCIETLMSRRGLLESLASSRASAPRDWPSLLTHVRKHGVEPWLANALDAAATIIAGALNVLGLKQVIITGSLTELPPAVVEHLAAAVRRGAMWARFGQVICQSAPRRRTAGLVAVGIDRLLVPATSARRAVAPSR